MIPATFEQWLNCIINQCQIELTQDFAKQQLSVYRNENNQETQVFVELYGIDHLKNIINWYSIYEK